MRRAKGRVGVVVPYFRAPDKLRRCLAALEAQTHKDHEVYVRDNSEDNILYTAAVNEGLRKFAWDGDFEHVLVLTQDAYLDPGCLRALVEFMRERPDCGIACPLQVAGGDAQPAPGAFRRALGLTPPDKRRVTWGGSLRAYPVGVHRADPLESYGEPFDTYWANGACMLVRVEAVREIGLFDANMRFLCSDADYSFTARARGWKVCVVPQARAEHSLDASGRAANPELELVKRRDLLYFSRKWLSGSLFDELSLEGRGISRTEVRHDEALHRREIVAMERGLRLVDHPFPPHVQWMTAMRLPVGAYAVPPWPGPAAQSPSISFRF